MKQIPEGQDWCHDHDQYFPKGEKCKRCEAESGLTAAPKGRPIGEGCFRCEPINESV